MGIFNLDRIWRARKWKELGQKLIVARRELQELESLKAASTAELELLKANPEVEALRIAHAELCELYPRVDSLAIYLGCDRHIPGATWKEREENFKKLPMLGKVEAIMEKFPPHVDFRLSHLRGEIKKFHEVQLDAVARIKSSLAERDQRIAELEQKLEERILAQHRSDRLSAVETLSNVLEQLKQIG